MRRRYLGLLQILRRSFRSTRGSDLVEYALILTLVSMLVTVSVVRYSCQLGCVIEQIGVAIEKERGHISPGQERRCTKPCQ